LWTKATYHKVQGFTVDTFSCHDRTGSGRVNETLAYVLQERRIVSDAHGIRCARIDFGRIVLDSKCTGQDVSGEDGRMPSNQART
jgi:hypothetical protein